MVIGILATPLRLTNAQTVEQLNSQIGSKRDAVGQLESEIDALNADIKKTQQQGASLRNQLSIIEQELAKIALDIEATKLRIQQTNLEIQLVNQEIEDMERQLEETKARTADVLRQIHLSDQVSVLEVLLVNESLGTFFDEVKALADVEAELFDQVESLKALRADLERKLDELGERIDAERLLKEQLANEQADVEERRVAQALLIEQSRLNEAEFRSFRGQLQAEQQQLQREIAAIERQVREELSRRADAERFKDFGPTRLSWPVPSRYVTARFHDPSYPFRHVFEHSGIDVRAAQGTPLLAPDGGFVAKVRDGGATGYSYILLVHNDGISTLFGHVSRIGVSADEYVAKGQSIGSTGGARGTRGAGPFTTAAHLHFEVRQNGIPVNPLSFLPPAINL